MKIYGKVYGSFLQYIKSILFLLKAVNVPGIFVIYLKKLY